MAKSKTLNPKSLPSTLAPLVSGFLCFQPTNPLTHQLFVFDSRRMTDDAGRLSNPTNSTNSTNPMNLTNPTNSTNPTNPTNPTLLTKEVKMNKIEEIMIKLNMKCRNILDGLNYSKNGGR